MDSKIWSVPEVQAMKQRAKEMESSDIGFLAKTDQITASFYEYFKSSNLDLRTNEDALVASVLMINWLSTHFMASIEAGTPLNSQELIAGTLVIVARFIPEPPADETT